MQTDTSIIEFVLNIISKSEHCRNSDGKNKELISIKNRTLCNKNILLGKKYILLRKNMNTMKKEQAQTAKVVQKIMAFRSKKGYSYQNMSDELAMTPAAYRKIETGETKLSVERLFRIAEILGEKITSFLDAEGNVFNQTISDSSTGNQYQQTIENFFQENKELYDKLLASKDDQINLLNNLLNNFIGKK